MMPTWTQFETAVTGPFGALIIMLVGAYAAYKVIVRHIIPMVDRLGTRHLDQFDQLIKIVSDLAEKLNALNNKFDDHITWHGGDRRTRETPVVEDRRRNQE